MFVGFGNLPNDTGRANLTSSLAATGHVEKGTTTSVKDHTSTGRWGTIYHQYWPIVRIDVDGETRVVSLRTFWSDRLEEFVPGQPIDVLYDPSRPTVAALGSPAAQALVAHDVRIDLTAGIIGAVLFLTGLPTWAWVFRRNAKAKRIHDADAAARGY
ncbi:hypothetical protein AX769_17670 [Frondihabitans sp. PAMC 28766]|uniref:DUF3592 domain-containing protein n=1 Tax=Frondihabitans sp. PAMC 28766 TaxID=1795630 RepID=UPI00078EF657|nr:DUF3592 domain-containing protein [Frondihabitans sp. PAMC 28766]AMM21635.1 hypothetical protein AX769_17670 [Frondihabitans sp. PAMC 28766]